MKLHPSCPRFEGFRPVQCFGILESVARLPRRVQDSPSIELTIGVASCLKWIRVRKGEKSDWSVRDRIEYKKQRNQSYLSSRRTVWTILVYSMLLVVSQVQNYWKLSVHEFRGNRAFFPEHRFIHPIFTSCTKDSTISIACTNSSNTSK